MISIRKKFREEKNCPICSDKSFLFAESKRFRIYKCKKCGFGFTYNLSEHLGEYHRDQEYLEEESLFKNIFEKRVKVISKLVKSGKVLEVGCSTGLLLSLLKNKGFEVIGIEISRKASEKAKQRGIKVFTTPYEKFLLNEKFDLIIFNHTLEHLKNPVEVLKKTKSLLKPKGFVYIDLPNFESLSAKIMKGRWELLLPEEHLWHFTEKSFKRLFKDLEFKTIYIEKTSGIWDFHNPVYELIISLKGMKKRFIKEFLTLLPSFFITKIGYGTDLMVLARRK